MKREIKLIEDLSLNAWPSHQIQFYDGWVLRFSYFYTHRTNSVEQLGPSSLPLDEKIFYCENIYRDWGTPAIFKITPLLEPDFEKRLCSRGYHTEHITEVMDLDLPEHFSCPENGPVLLEHKVSDRWINGLFALKGTTNAMHRLVVPSMYRAIPKETICASIWEDGRIAATGLGILDRNYIGLYAIHVHPSFRRRGYARSLCTSILNAGRDLGASRAYLQVVKDNQNAKALYQSLGFQDLYTYWFRVKESDYSPKDRAQRFSISRIGS